MMTYDELETYEDALLRHLGKVRARGGFDTHAENEIIIFQALYEVVRHLREKAPKPRKKNEESE